MTSARLKSIAQKWFEVFNSHDLEKLLSLYDDRAVHYSPKLKIRQPETNGWIKGKDALRSWWMDSFNRLPTLKYRILHIIAAEDRVFMEYIRKVEGDEDMNVGEVLEIRDGLIVAFRVYHG